LLLSLVALLNGAPVSAAAPAGEAAAPRSTINARLFDIPDPLEGGQGGRIYLSHCASCHDLGLDRAPQRAVLALMSPQSIHRALTQGVMTIQGAALTAAERIAVAEFIANRTMDAASKAADPPACQADAARFDHGEPPVFAGWGLSPGGTRFVPSAEAGIDRHNVDRLRLRWAVAFPNAIRARSQPALAGGALFVGSHNGAVYALDRETGCARWIHQTGSEVRTGIVVAPWRAGDVQAAPHIYFGDLAGNVHAVDAQTGRPVWRRRVDAHPNATITGTPTLHAGVLYVPVSSLELVRPVDPQYACCTFRGSVVALDAATGSIRWQTFAVSEPRRVGQNPIGVDRHAPSGAPIWNAPTIDAQRNLLYVGTGENYSSPPTDTSDAVIAMDLGTGRIRWVYQGLAGDAYNTACIAADTTNCPAENGPDYDISAGVMLSVDGAGREVLVAGQKSGVVHALDPDDGALLWRAKPGRGGILGGIHFGMAAGEGRAYVPVYDAPDGRRYDEPARPGVHALDLRDGRVVWRASAPLDTCAGRALCIPGYSQAITATPELVFAGSGDGWLRVLDTQTGRLLWQVDTTRSVSTVSGETAAGGSMSGGAGPLPHRGWLFVSSGYGFGPQMPGNLLMAFEVERAPGPTNTPVTD
jgi:polyvinyl alcohol dehydrogenase (cytochrome)